MIDVLPNENFQGAKSFTFFQPVSGAKVFQILVKIAVFLFLNRIKFQKVTLNWFTKNFGKLLVRRKTSINHFCSLDTVL